MINLKSPLLTLTPLIRLSSTVGFLPPSTAGLMCHVDLLYTDLPVAYCPLAATSGPETAMRIKARVPSIPLSEPTQLPPAWESKLFPV